MGRGADLSATAALLFTLMLQAVADDSAAVRGPGPHNSAEVPSVATLPPAGATRIYSVSDVSLIVGGASEDAKAKVSRLPVRD